MATDALDTSDAMEAIDSIPRFEQRVQRMRAEDASALCVRKCTTYVCVCACVRIDRMQVCVVCARVHTYACAHVHVRVCDGPLGRCQTAKA